MSITRNIYAGRAKNFRKDDNGKALKTDKKYIVIHNTSNSASAANEASYAKSRKDGVSSHYYVDEKSILQSLDTDMCANHVGSSEGNLYGIAYEITGTNSKSKSWWLGNVAWALLRAQIAKDCKEHNITPRLLTVKQIKDGKMSGIITHNQARLAWGHTTHTDPGENFPMEQLFSGTATPTTPTKPTTPKPQTPTQGWTEKLMNELPELHAGSKSAFVGRAQALLNTYGAGLKEDDDCGPATTRATINYQRSHDLTPDGWIGRKTWTKLLLGK